MPTRFVFGSGSQVSAGRNLLDVFRRAEGPFLPKGNHPNNQAGDCFHPNRATVHPPSTGRALRWRPEMEPQYRSPSVRKPLGMRKRTQFHRLFLASTAIWPPTGAVRYPGGRVPMRKLKFRVGRSR